MSDTPLESMSSAAQSEESVNATGHQGQAHRDIEKVTDYAEEAEVDAKKLDKAMTFLSGVNQSKKDADAAEKIVISKEDIQTIMQELEVSRLSAEKALHKAKGNVLDALRQLIASPSYR